jgi:hypothetical protein
LPTNDNRSKAINKCRRRVGAPPESAGVRTAATSAAALGGTTAVTRFAHVTTSRNRDS